MESAAGRYAGDHPKARGCRSARTTERYREAQCRRTRRTPQQGDDRQRSGHERIPQTARCLLRAVEGELRDDSLGAARGARGQARLSMERRRAIKLQRGKSRCPFSVQRIRYFANVSVTLAPARRASRTLRSPLTLSQALDITSSARSWGTTTIPSTSAKTRSPGRTAMPPQRIATFVSTTSIRPSESYGVNPLQKVGKPSSTISA